MPMPMTPAVLVVAEPTDGGARAACRLASAGLGGGTEVALIGPRELAAGRWSQRLDADGRSRTRISAGAAGGRAWQIDSDRLRLVWFRTRLLRLRGVADSDADYAEAELTALVVSWLSALGDRVVNRVDGACAVGPSWSGARWLAVAAGAGLPVARRSAATSARLVAGWRGSPWDARRPFDGRRAGSVAERVLVVDGVAVGRSDAGMRLQPEGCRALAESSGCRLLRLDLDAEGLAVGVDPCPPLTGSDQVAAVADLLRPVRPAERAA